VIEGKMGMTYGAYEGEEERKTGFGWEKSEVKELHGRPRPRRRNDIKMDLKGT